jgi:alpha-L-fucosidase
MNRIKVTRRDALKMMGSATLLGSLASRDAAPALGQMMTAGSFTDTRASLANYRIPDWFADAKFGIWAHWGPQSAVGDGDWYARNMYMEGSKQYEYHRQRFGPQSKVGYKDLINLFTASEWDPEHLMDLYQKAGAKYFFSMGVHHDNYDMWNSKYQPRWNAMASGPKRDIVGEWAAAARKRGIRFGVSEHLSNSFEWFAPSHLADTKGEYAGVPYDGQELAYADLYHDYSAEPKGFAESILHAPMGRDKAPLWWQQQYFHRIKDLIDQHQPDLLYTDGGIPFDHYGLSTVAELYNVGPVTQEARAASIYFSKTETDCVHGSSCVMDHERSVLSAIDPIPWQTDTCIGGWHYKVGQKYKTPKKVIDMLVDIVSKNGNLLLSIPLPATGVPDPEEIKILESITAWTQTNGEAIFATRPWKIYGEGPSTKVVIKPSGKEFDPNESRKPDLTMSDIRFTTKGETLYALVMGWPENGVVDIESLALGGAQKPMKAVDVRMLGQEEPLQFTHDGKSLRVTLKGEPLPSASMGIGLRVRFV